MLSFLEDWRQSVAKGWDDRYRDLDAKARDSTLERALSWRDLQHLDHLEYEIERLEHFLGQPG